MMAGCDRSSLTASEVLVFFGFYLKFKFFMLHSGTQYIQYTVKHWERIWTRYVSPFVSQVIITITIDISINVTDILANRHNKSTCCRWSVKWRKITFSCINFSWSFLLFSFSNGPGALRWQSVHNVVFGLDPQCNKHSFSVCPLHIIDRLCQEWVLL